MKDMAIFVESGDRDDFFLITEIARGQGVELQSESFDAQFRRAQCWVMSNNVLSLLACSGLR